MSSPPPLFRPDLTVSEKQTESGTVLIVKDPGTGDIFRFREIEQFIARQFDGVTPVEAIRRRTEERYGAALPADRLAAFVASLERAGLLASKNVGARRRRRQVRVSPLYWRVELVDPARLLDWLSPRVRWCYTRSFVWVAAATIALAVVTMLAGWSDVKRDVAGLIRLSAIPPLLVVALVVVCAHEFAHALTCRRFGGEVREMGFMLLYFQPALYCNVSDAWLFPEKSQRLWVGFAGPFFELTIWAVAVLAWRVTAVETWINQVSLMVMASSGVRTLFNFLPLIKLDGYYLLSDYLDIPNLRAKAFRYVGARIARLTGWSERTLEPLSARERRVYLAYGLLAAAFSFTLLGVIAARFGGFLIDHNQPLAFAGLVGIVGARLRRNLRQFTEKPVADERGDNGVAEQPPAETRAGPSSVPATPVSPRKGRRRRRRTRVIALAGIAVAVLLLGRMELRIGGPFAIMPVHNADVRAEIEGLVEEIYVTEGQQVRAGEIVARLSGRGLRAQLDETEARIRQTQAQLRMLRAGPTREEVELARTAVGQAEDGARYARARLERNGALAEKELLPRTELEKTQEAALMAENELVEARQKLQLLQRGARPEEVAGMEAEMARLDAHRRFLADQLGRMEVRSPITGVVATPARQLRERVGQAVAPGELIARVYEMKQLTVEIAVPEKEIADVAVGRKVALKARAFPNRTFHGVVTSIATSAQGGATAGESASVAREDPQTVLVTTEIDNGSLLLKPGMTGRAKIFAGPRRIADLVLRRSARTVKVEFWSWW